eukprot:365638-Chlamydomonas_euryale.AAC.3
MRTGMLCALAVLQVRRAAATLAADRLAVVPPPSAVLVLHQVYHSSLKRTVIERDRSPGAVAAQWVNARSNARRPGCAAAARPRSER